MVRGDGSGLPRTGTSRRCEHRPVKREDPSPGSTSSRRSVILLVLVGHVKVCREPTMVGVNH